MSKQTKSRMNPKVKKLWVELLRSGKFTQYQRSLRDWHKADDPARCCLGVLCEVRSKISHRNVWQNEKIVEDFDGLLNEGMLRWAGLDDKTQCKLSKMNDGGATFRELADYIDKEL